MEEIKVETAYVVEGLSFSTRKEAETHLAFVKLHKNVTDGIYRKGLGNRVLMDRDQELIGLILNHIIDDRVAIRAILNGISGWEDNKIEPAIKPHDQLKKLVDDCNKLRRADDWPAIPNLVPMAPSVFINKFDDHPGSCSYGANL